MKREQWQKIELIFAELDGLPSESRRERLEELCGSDWQLKHEVQSLLDCPVETDGFLEPVVPQDPATLDSLPGVPTEIGFPSVPGYRVFDEIGRGGMGIVYAAYQEGTKRTVALKVMQSGPLTSGSAVRRFNLEIELAARLRHPNVARILESGQLASGQSYYAMDFVEGVTLDEYLRRETPSVDQIVRLFLQLCDAVDHAHRHAVVHCDLKPRNVLVDSDERPQVLDFGLAKAIDQSRSTIDEDISATGGRVVGTLAYLAPEQTRGGEAEIDHRTDVHALGVMLYEALTGVVPFGGDDDTVEVLRRVAEERPRQPIELSEDVPSEISAIVLKAMEKEKDRRYQSVREFGDDLQRFLSGGPPPDRGAWFWKNRKRAALIAGLGILLGTSSLYLAWQVGIDHLRDDFRRISRKDQRVRLALDHEVKRLYGTALEYLDEAIDLDLEDPAPPTYAGRICLKQMFKERTSNGTEGEGDRALGYFSEAIRRAPGDWSGYRARAIAHLCLQQYEEAIHDFETVMSLSPERYQSWARRMRATPLWITGQHLLAIEDYRAFLRQHALEGGGAEFAHARLSIVLRDRSQLLRAEGDEVQAERSAAEARATIREGLGRGQSPWVESILRTLLGDEAPNSLLLAAEESPFDLERRCEALYYAGEAERLAGNLTVARGHFEACLRTGYALDADSTSIDPMNEFHLARWRLDSTPGEN